MDRFAGLVQRILQLLLFRVVGGRCSLADLSGDVIETLLNGLVELIGVVIVIVLRRAVIEQLSRLLHLLLKLLSTNCVCSRTGFVRRVTIFVVVAEGLEFIRHGLEILGYAIFLLIDLLSSTASIARIAGVIGELFCFVGNLILLVPQALGLVLQLSQAIFHRTVLALAQQTLGLL